MYSLMLNLVTVGHPFERRMHLVLTYRGRPCGVFGIHARAANVKDMRYSLHRSICIRSTYSANEPHQRDYTPKTFKNNKRRVINEQ
jgi:hypothetical protein